MLIDRQRRLFVGWLMTGRTEFALARAIAAVVAFDLVLLGRRERRVTRWHGPVGSALKDSQMGGLLRYLGGGLNA